MSLALSRTARETEIGLQIQRDLVFAVESVQTHLRVATRWTKFTEDSAPPVAPEDLVVGYSIWGHTYSQDGGYEESLLATVQLAEGNRLYVDQRLISRRIADFRISGEDLSGEDLPTYIAEIYVESVDSMPFVGSNQLPLSLRLLVAMRNHQIAPPKIVAGPTASEPAGNAVTIYWKADSTHTGYVHYWDKRGPSHSQGSGIIHTSSSAEEHSISIPLNRLQKGLVEYRVFIVDVFGRPVFSAYSTFSH